MSKRRGGDVHHRRVGHIACGHGYRLRALSQRGDIRCRYIHRPAEIGIERGVIVHAAEVNGQRATGIQSGAAAADGDRCLALGNVDGVITGDGVDRQRGGISIQRVVRAGVGNIACQIHHARAERNVTGNVGHIGSGNQHAPQPARLNGSGVIDFIQRDSNGLARLHIGGGASDLLIDALLGTVDLIIAGKGIDGQRRQQRRRGFHRDLRIAGDAVTGRIGYRYGGWINPLRQLCHIVSGHRHRPCTAVRYGVGIALAIQHHGDGITCGTGAGEDQRRIFIINAKIAVISRWINRGHRRRAVKKQRGIVDVGIACGIGGDHRQQLTARGHLSQIGGRNGEAPAAVVADHRVIGLIIQRNGDGIAAIAGAVNQQRLGLFAGIDRTILRNGIQR